MVQLGFVIDHTRCIGCHACTVACKSENQVPLGSFRTWVKYTEEGTFPEVRRSFAVLRCNQCTEPPCVEICPVSALSKSSSNGIVDVDPRACIGCKACMHGCPYDALYINPHSGLAEKCHFCAHRTEMGLAPACAVVCPTEAIVPGDFDDPQSRVSILRGELDLAARKLEAGTQPNVFYREVSAAGIDPALTNMSHGYIWSEPLAGEQLDAQTFEALEERARARTTYDVPRKTPWGGMITGYLFAKSLAAGIFPMAFLALGAQGLLSDAYAALLSLLALGLTGLLLIADLKRPARFFYILIRPNWSSWLARGTFVITAYAALLTGWLVASLAGAGLTDTGVASGVSTFLAWVTLGVGWLTAAYTGWLFAQAKGRVLWMKRGYWFHLIVQANVAGSALLLALQPFVGWSAETAKGLAILLAVNLLFHLILVLLDEKCAPAGREKEYHRAVRVVTKGPYATSHWGMGVAAGIGIPLLLLAVQVFTGGDWLAALAGALALVGLWTIENVFVRAGQALPIS